MAVCAGSHIFAARHTDYSDRFKIVYSQSQKRSNPLLPQYILVFPISMTPVSARHIQTDLSARFCHRTAPVPDECMDLMVKGGEIDD